MTDSWAGVPRSRAHLRGTRWEAHLCLGAGAAHPRPAAGPWPSAAAGGSAGGRPRGCSRRCSGASRPSETVRQGFSRALGSFRSAARASHQSQRTPQPPAERSPVWREPTKGLGLGWKVLSSREDAPCSPEPRTPDPARPPDRRCPRGQAGGSGPLRVLVSSGPRHPVSELTATVRDSEPVSVSPWPRPAGCSGPHTPRQREQGCDGNWLARVTRTPAVHADWKEVDVEQERCPRPVSPPVRGSWWKRRSGFRCSSRPAAPHPTVSSHPVASSSPDGSHLTRSPRAREHLPQGRFPDKLVIQAQHTG